MTLKKDFVPGSLVINRINRNGYVTIGIITVVTNLTVSIKWAYRSMSILDSVYPLAYVIETDYLEFIE